MSQEIGCESCQFLKVRAWELAQCHFYWIISVKQSQSSDLRGGDIDPTSQWKGCQRILDLYFKTSILCLSASLPQIAHVCILPQIHLPKSIAVFIQ